MSKVFKYAVKYKGKYYPPNTPIEEAVEVTAEKVEKPKPKKGKVKKDAE